MIEKRLRKQGGWEYNERSTTKMVKNRKGMMYMSVVDAICELVVGGCLYGISLKDFMKNNNTDGGSGSGSGTGVSKDSPIRLVSSPEGLKWN